jgi:putative endonuclease
MHSNSQAILWYIYMVRTKHGHLYTGITQNVARRFLDHQEEGKKAAKYLRGKGPFKLVFQQKIGNHSTALKTEFALKKMSKQQKETLTNKSGRFSLDGFKIVQSE